MMATEEVLSSKVFSAISDRYVAVHSWLHPASMAAVDLTRVFPTPRHLTGEGEVWSFGMI
jgi:hypothetical protein